MSFSNPAGPNPVPPVLYRDYWAWTSIDGEPYAPAGATFATLLGKPAWSVGGSHVILSNLPRTGPDQTAPGTVTWTLYIANTANINASFSIQPFHTDASSTQLLVPMTGGPSNSTWTDSGGATYSLYASAGVKFTATMNAWHTVVMTFTEVSGTCTTDITIDGVRPVKVDGTALFPQTGGATTALFCPQLQAGGNGVGTVYVSGPKLAWS